MLNYPFPLFFMYYSCFFLCCTQSTSAHTHVQKDSRCHFPMHVSPRSIYNMTAQSSLVQVGFPKPSLSSNRKP